RQHPPGGQNVVEAPRQLHGGCFPPRLHLPQQSVGVGRLDTEGAIRQAAFGAQGAEPFRERRVNNHGTARHQGLPGDRLGGAAAVTRRPAAHGTEVCDIWAAGPGMWRGMIAVDRLTAVDRWGDLGPQRGAVYVIIGYYP